jgi:hypothetical protein
MWSSIPAVSTNQAIKSSTYGCFFYVPNKQPNNSKTLHCSFLVRNLTLTIFKIGSSTPLWVCKIIAARCQVIRQQQPF